MNRWHRTLFLALAVPFAACAAASEGPRTGTGGSTGSGGGTVTGSGGASGSGGAASGTGGAVADLRLDTPPVVDVMEERPVDLASLDKFSFFVTSLTAMRRLSKNQMGFGGDLRYGEATGLAGADKICTEIAESSMPGAGAKGWRAFLSTVAGPVHAIDRVGNGPWYDRMGRVIALTKAALMQTRPMGADPAIINDLPNEDGIPNHTDGMPGCTGNACPDNHDFLTGTNAQGRVYSMNMSNTCNDWTSAAAVAPGNTRGPWCGHSWPRQGSGENWMSALAEGGCGPGVNLREMGGPMQGVYTVGTGGGYGGIYCFALTP
jgi:hypothetical protein